jgi:uncharacterized protein (UPF0548 family)
MTAERQQVAADFDVRAATCSIWARALRSYEVEHKMPLCLGSLPGHVEVVEGEFWCFEIARHDGRRLSYAVWSVLSRRLLT